MSTLVLNSNQTTNGAGQVVPTRSRGHGESAAYQTFVASMTGTGTVTASVQIQGSNDAVNWVNVGSALSATGAGPVSAVVNSTYQYFQGVVSAITGTSAAVTVTMGV